MKLKVFKESHSYSDNFPQLAWGKEETNDK